jgi:hypothetical protein
MKTTELTVQLPERDVQFLKEYAAKHAISISDLLTRYVQGLQGKAKSAPHPSNLAFTGVIPADVDAREEYRKYIEKKHR